MTTSPDSFDKDGNYKPRPFFSTSDDYKYLVVFIIFMVVCFLAQ